MSQVEWHYTVGIPMPDAKTCMPELASNTFRSKGMETLVRHECIRINIQEKVKTDVRPRTGFQ